MHLRTELLREHSARQTEKLTDYACLRRSHFDELLAVFFNGTPREKQLAADVLAMASTQRAAWLLPHLEALLAAAQPTTGHHPAVRRAVAKALQFISVPEAWQALAFDTCLALLASPTEPVAIRAYALSAASRLALPYPELAAEVLAAAERALNTTDSAALRSRAARELPKLRRKMREGLPG
jgi:hypothetical protein